MDNADTTTPTLRDRLEASVDALQPEVVEVAAPIAAIAPASETTEQARARDEAGRFAKAADQPVVPSPEVVTTTVTPPATPDPRPQSWKKEMEPHWVGLTPEVKAYIQQREAQFAGGVSTYKGIADSAKPLMDAVAPFQADIERTGMQAPQAVQALLGAHRTLSTGDPQSKLQLFNKLAQDYGIPIAAFYDPAVQQQYLNSAPRQQVPAQQPVDVNKAVEQALLSRDVQQTVARMEQDAEKYPMFSYVRATMSKYIETGEATDLEGAYQLAVEAPEHAKLAELFATQQTQAAEQKRVADAATAARVARANVSSVKSATPASTTPAPGKKTTREILSEQYDAKMGGLRV